MVDRGPRFTSNPRIPFALPSTRPRLAAPHGRPLVIQVVVNVEYWAFDQPTPRTIVIPPHGKYHVPDIPNFSWSEYGNRCGMPRLIEALRDRQIPVGASMNASAIDAYPALADEILEAGWELIGHGVQQRSLGTEATEAETIAAALAKLKQFSGKSPRGWMSPGWSETFDTPDLLKSLGIEFIYEWVIDDVPNWMTTKHGPLLSLPYSLDLNDSVIFAIEKHSSSEMRDRIRQSVVTFEREIANNGQPLLMTIPLHPHLSGVPHRINYLCEILDELLARSDTCFMHGHDVFEWYRAQNPAPDA